MRSTLWSSAPTRVLIWQDAIRKRGMEAVSRTSPGRPSEIALHPSTGGRSRHLAADSERHSLGPRYRHPLLDRDLRSARYLPTWMPMPSHPPRTTSSPAGTDGNGALIGAAESGAEPDEPVATRLDELDAAGREAVQALALGGPLPLGNADHVADVDLLARLEAAGIVSMVEISGTLCVGLGHPSLAEAIRSGLGPLQQRRAALRAAEALETSGGFALRASHLRIRHELPVPSPQALAAARQAMALGHPDLARSLLDHAEVGFEVDLLRAAALGASGRHEQADRELERAAASAPDDATRARATCRRGHNLRAAGRLTDAVSILEAGITTVDDPYWRGFVAADLAYARSWTGSTTSLDIVATSDDQSERHGVLRKTRANECLVGAVLEVMNGRLAAAKRLAAEGMPLVAFLEDDVPAARELLSLSEFLALAFGGEHERASALVETELDLTLAAARAAGTGGETAAPGLWLATRAMQALARGDLPGALHDVDAAEPRLVRADAVGMLPLALAVRSTALAGQGRVAASAAAADSVAEEWRQETKVRMQLEVAASWRLAGAGRTDEAARRLAVAAEAAAENDHVIFAGLAVLDALRLDRAGSVTTLVRPVLDRWEGDLSAGVRAHAEALLADDPEALLVVARRHPGLGFDVAGAEAAMQAARRFEERGDTAAAAHAEFVAATLAEPIGGCSRIALGHPRGLTDREREIALLAADGRASRDIAASLGVSARTVDNHLAAVYRKVGVSGRKDLSVHLAALRGGPVAAPISRSSRFLPDG
jgi:DNA-binding CsgD family transcriptional regulator/tetratricopeptide (TPR) repeat protein